MHGDLRAKACVRSRIHSVLVVPQCQQLVDVNAGLCEAKMGTRHPPPATPTPTPTPGHATSAPQQPHGLDLQQQRQHDWQ